MAWTRETYGLGIFKKLSAAFGAGEAKTHLEIGLVAGDDGNEVVGAAGDAAYAGADIAADKPSAMKLLAGIWSRLSAPLTSGGITPRATAAIAKPASATAYSIGDHLGNNLVAANVTPIEFTVARATSGAGASGRLTGMRCVASTADGSALTTANLAFDLLVFRKAANVPFAAGAYPADNDTISIPKASVLQLVGVFSFTASGWKTSGFAQGVAYQSAKLNSDRPFAPFNLADLVTDKLVAVAAMTAAWGASNVAHSIDFILDVEGN